MTYPGCSKKTKSSKARKHTPVVSKAQQGMMGAELARRRKGKASQMPSMKTTDLEGHLHESAGKNLPARANLRKALKKSKR